VKQGVVFDGVGFRYPGSARKALDGISLVLQPGEHLALVGANGSGKTTLAKLLCRLYDPCEGRITIDGVDLQAMDTTTLRRCVGVVFQDYVRYHLTARENIWLGDSELPPQDERIVRAARAAHADQTLAKLPQGYETILSNRFEGGEELSVGEWQRIALARAFLRDSAIVILDEPTSSLDAATEHDILERVRHLTQGRVSLLISHRLSTVRHADRICVLDRGRIIELGSHDELMARNGIYAKMFALQAESYAESEIGAPYK
jgi:ATP-binding cassette, subfamily B, bacterial